MADQSLSLPRDTLQVRGADARSWLDGLLTCAVTQVQSGHAGYGLLLTKQGKIVSDVWLAFGTDATLYVGVAPGHGAAVQALLDRYLVMEDADLSAPGSPLAWRVAVDAAAHSSEGELASGSIELGGTRLAVQVSSSSAAAPLATELLARAGIGTYGVDFTDHDNPHEAALDRVAVSWTKGCYLGQEVVCMQDMRGKVKRRLTGLVGDAALLGLVTDAAAQGAVPVLAAGGAELGRVTSVHPSPEGAWLLASMAAAALEAPPEGLSVLGHEVRLGSAKLPSSS